MAAPLDDHLALLTGGGRMGRQTPIPYDEVTEQQVLGAVLVAPPALDAVEAAGVTPDTFYTATNGQIYRAALAVRDRGEAVDFITVTKEVGSGAQKQYVESLGNHVYTVQLPNVRAHAAALLDLERRRAIIGATHEAQQLALVGTSDQAFAALHRAMAALAEPTALASDLFQLYTPQELLEFPESEYLVEPFLIRGKDHVLFGPTGTYKTFLAIAWAAQAPGLVVYVSAEGSAWDLGRRIVAWEKAAGRPSNIRCQPWSINLLTDAEKLVRSIRAYGDPVLVVIDTKARNTPGANEDKSLDMGLLTASLDLVRRELDCGTLMLDHVGNAETERRRGSSQQGQASDIEIRAKSLVKCQVRLECHKMREAEKFEPVVVRLEPVDGTLGRTHLGTEVSFADSLDTIHAI
jgi:AAA domain/DnaB-like helicase N terminal domain